MSLQIQCFLCSGNWYVANHMWTVVTTVVTTHVCTLMQLNTGQEGDAYQGYDLNVEKAWLQGLTGCNVTLTIVDDGIDACYFIVQDKSLPHKFYRTGLHT